MEKLGQTCSELQRNKCEVDDFDKECHEIRSMIQALGSGKPVEIRAKTPSGPKISAEDIDRWNKAASKTDK